MQYDAIEIGKAYVVTSRGGWVATVKSKFKSTADGTEYVELEDTDGRGGFNYPSQIAPLDKIGVFTHTARIKDTDGTRRTVKITMDSYLVGDLTEALTAEYGKGIELISYHTATN